MTPTQDSKPLMAHAIAVDFFRTEHNLGQPLICWRLGCAKCGWEFHAALPFDHGEWLYHPVHCETCGTNRATGVLLREMDSELEHYPEVKTLVIRNSPDAPWMEY